MKTLLTLFTVLFARAALDPDIVSFPLELTKDLKYQSIVYVGSQRQKMKFTIDTESPWVWMPGIECPADECAASSLFNFEESPSYNATDRLVKLELNNGYLKGNLVSDQFMLTKTTKRKATI
jgi:hypothetical protein